MPSNTFLQCFPNFYACLKLCYWSPGWLLVICAQQKCAWHPNRNSTRQNAEFPILCQQHTSHSDTFVLLEGSVCPHKLLLVLGRFLPLLNTKEMPTRTEADVTEAHGTYSELAERVSNTWVHFQSRARVIGSYTLTAAISSYKPVILYLSSNLLVPFLKIFI